MLRKLLPAVFALVLTATGFAFAEVGVTDEPVVVEETTTTITEGDGATTTTTAPADDGTPTTTTLVGDGTDGSTTGVVRSYDGCGEFTEGNHGDYVSGIAKTKPHEPGAVPDAAHSNCGKPVQSVVGDTTTTTVGETTTTLGETTTTLAGTELSAETESDGPSNNGRGNGRGRR